MNLPGKDPALEALQDPSTSPQALSEIATSRPDLLATVATHPNCYPALSEWIAQVTSTPGPTAPPQITSLREPAAQVWPFANPAPPDVQERAADPVPPDPVSSDDEVHPLVEVQSSRLVEPTAIHDAGAPALPDADASQPGSGDAQEDVNPFDAPALPLQRVEAPALPTKEDEAPSGGRRLPWMALGLLIGLVVGGAGAVFLVVLVLPGLFGSVL